MKSDGAHRTPTVLYVASTSSHLKRFHQPYIKALKSDLKVFTMANGDGVDFHVPFQKSFFSPKNFGATWTIRRILRRERFDAVILNTSLAAFLVRVAMIGMRRRPSVLNIVHGYLFDVPFKGKKDRLMLLCERFTARYTDEIAVMNEADLKIAEEYRLAKGKIHFIRGMGYTLDRKCIETDSALRESIAPAHEVLLSFVGELSTRKNQSFLIRCVHKLRAKGIPVRLMLVGEGSEREALEMQIKELGLTDSVILLGNCEPVLPYLAITDLYVSASRIEGLPFNVMEAMACGLPMILSDCKGQTDLLACDANRLYPVGDEDTFCRLVEQALETDCLGVGSTQYKVLETYTLDSVFHENLNIMKGFF